MSGIMVAVAGISLNAVFAPDLIRVGSGVDPSPITLTRGNDDTPRTVEWIGYIRPAQDSPSLSLTAQWSSDDPFNDQYSRAYLWYGPTAISGYTTENAALSADDGFVQQSFSLIAGQYYPVRIRWDYYLPYSNNFFVGYDTSGSFALDINTSIDLTGQIFYNTLTNGF